MNLFNVLEYALLGLLAVVLVSLLAGHFLGYPVLLGYVDSGSMEPTLDEGDGFIAVPAALAGDVGTGDVVVFQAEQVHDGEVTTHRIVEERREGYITQGDNNPFPDQGTGEPPVTEGQIKAVVLTVDGEVVEIPHLGTGAEVVGSAIGGAERRAAQALGVRRLGTQQLSYLLFGLGLVAFVAMFVLDRAGTNRMRARERSRSRAGVFDTRLLLVGGILLLAGGATVGMVAPAGSETYGIVSTEGNSSNPTVIPQGESDTLIYQIHNGGHLPTVSYFEPRSEGVTIDPDRVELARAETRNVSVTLEAPDETGYYLRSQTEYRYYVVVPPSMIDSLYDVHPWAPYALINAVIVTPFVFLWLVFGGPTNKIRLRSRDRERTTGLLDRL